MPLQFDTLSSSGLRRLVRDLRRALSATGQAPLPQHVAQEVVARQLGHADWHAAHQQALRVDRTRIRPVSVPPLSPVSPVRSVMQSSSSRAIEKLPIVAHELFAEEQAVLEQLRQGVPLATAATSFFQAHLDKRPSAKDLHDESARLALALATTEGPWIHSWHIAPEASGKYLVDLPDYVPDHEAFSAMTDALLRADEHTWGAQEGGWYAGPLRQQIGNILSGVSNYERSLTNYASRGQISAGSPVLEVFEDPHFFAYLLKADVAAATTRIKPFVFDEKTSPADRLGMLQRLVDLVGQAHPKERTPRSEMSRRPWETAPVQVPALESLLLLTNLFQIEPVSSTLKSTPALLMELMSVIAGIDRYKAEGLGSSGGLRGQVQAGPLKDLLDSPGFQETMVTSPEKAARQLAPVLSQTPQEQWVAAYQRVFEQTSKIVPAPEQDKKGVSLYRLGRLTLNAALDLEQAVEHAYQQRVVQEVKPNKPGARKSLGEAIGASPTGIPAAPALSRRRSR